MICNSRKPPHKTGKVLFIDAKMEVERKNAESRLTPIHIEKILGAYRGYKNIDHFAYVATAEEIRSKECNIAIQMYVTTDASANIGNIDLPVALKVWEGCASETDASLEMLATMF